MIGLFARELLLHTFGKFPLALVYIAPFQLLYLPQITYIDHKYTGRGRVWEGGKVAMGGAEGVGRADGR
jgi:hypothetical protein